MSAQPLARCSALVHHPWVKPGAGTNVAHSRSLYLIVARLHRDPAPHAMDVADKHGLT